MTGPYERLLAIAQEQERLVADGRVAETDPLTREWDAIASTLPETPPAEAADLLRELERLVRAVTVSLASSRSDASEAMSRLARGRRAVAGYGGPSGSSLRASG